MTKRILLGHIATAHGIKGEVSIKSYTADPEAIGSYGPLSDEAGLRPIELISVRSTGKGVIARIKGVADRTAAEALRGRALTVDRAVLPEADDGDYYHEDLIGMAAVSPEGAPLGQVLSVQNFGAGDLLELRLKGLRHTELLPFTDAFVPSVDVASRRVVVILPVFTEADLDDGEEPPADVVKP